MTEQTRTIEELIRQLLVALGEDPQRRGLVDTPARVARMFAEFFIGYDQSKIPRLTIFPNCEDGVVYNQMLIDKGYYFSYCEHHIVPFFGEYAFGYIPDKYLLGASKIARTIDYFAGRLQIAERLVQQVVDHIDSVVCPKGSILVMWGRHLCKEMRGVRKYGSPYEAIATTGVFYTNENGCKDEFLSRIK